MSAKIDSTNAVWGELIDITLKEPYIFLDRLTIWKDENKEFVLLKPFLEFNLDYEMRYIFV